MYELTVKHTQDRHKKPLCVVRDFPGGDAELTPEQMRSLASVLNEAANDCECQYKMRSGFIHISIGYKWGAP